MKSNGNCWKCSSCSQHHDSDLCCWWGSECKRVEWITIYREKILHTFKYSIFMEYEVYVLPHALWSTRAEQCPRSSWAAEEAATWACTLGHGWELRSHKDTGDQPPHRDHMCLKPKVQCSTGWCLTPCPSEASAGMTRISPRLAARVRDLSCQACWLTYFHVLMFGSH